MISRLRLRLKALRLLLNNNFSTLSKNRSLRCKLLQKRVSTLNQQQLRRLSKTVAFLHKIKIILDIDSLPLYNGTRTIVEW